jgi:hypothetical protein
MKTVLIAKYELGCFNIGPPGFSSGTERPALRAVFVGCFKFIFIMLAVTDSMLSWT